MLYRQLPRVKKYLAYLPEGPTIDWLGGNLQAWLDPARRAPAQRPARSGSASGRRSSPAAGAPTRSSGRSPTSASPGSARRSPTRSSTAASALRQQLRDLGWHPPSEDEGFAAGQPRFVFQLPVEGETPASLLAGMNQLWRRNIKKAEKLGVTVTQGTRDDLAAFHAVYVETAERDHFTPRPLSYFETMWDALRAEDPDRIRLYLAHHEGDLVAATTWVRVGRHAWYSYGASSTAKREVRGSNAIQWRMICDALDAGASVYDLRGITEGLEADDPHLGLIQFKVGTGGQAVEYLGEWDLPLNPLLYKAFDVYMKRR